jgi:hypothetical protein
MELSIQKSRYVASFMAEAERHFPRKRDEKEPSKLTAKWRMWKEMRREWRRQRNIIAWALVRMHIEKPKWVNTCIADIDEDNSGS